MGSFMSILKTTPYPVCRVENRMRLILSAAVVGTAIATSAAAAPVTIPSDFTPDAVETFEGIALNTSGPIITGPMTVDAPGWLVRAQGFTQYPGIFEGQYFGQSAVTVTITFATDMQAVGFGLFDPNFSGTKVEAFDRSGTLLESVFPPTGPTGGGFSTFTGVQRATAEIASIV